MDTHTRTRTLILAPSMLLALYYYITPVTFPATWYAPQLPRHESFVHCSGPADSVPNITKTDGPTAFVVTTTAHVITIFPSLSSAPNAWPEHRSSSLMAQGYSPLTPRYPDPFPVLISPSLSEPL